MKSTTVVEAITGYANTRHCSSQHLAEVVLDLGLPAESIEILLRVRFQWSEPRVQKPVGLSQGE